MEEDGRLNSVIWLVSARKEIVQNENELFARSDYIRKVTNATPTEWRIIPDRNGCKKYYMCHTNVP